MRTKRRRPTHVALACVTAVAAIGFFALLIAGPLANGEWNESLFGVALRRRLRPARRAFSTRRSRVCARGAGHRLRRIARSPAR